MVKPSTQQLNKTNAFTKKPDTSEWVKQQTISAKKRKGGVARATSLSGDAFANTLSKKK